MSMKGHPIILPDGEVIYVNIDDMDQLDMDPRVKLDRYHCKFDDATFSADLCEVKPEIKEEVDDGSYNIAENMNVVAADGLSDFKMEVDDEEKESLVGEIKGKVITSEIDIKQEPTTTAESHVMEKINVSSGDDEEFRGFGHVSPTSEDSFPKPNAEFEAQSVNNNPSWGHHSSIGDGMVASGKSRPRFLFPKTNRPSTSTETAALPEKYRKTIETSPFKEIGASFGTNTNASGTQAPSTSTETAASPEKYRKTVATSPFKEIEASFGTNPLILPEEDEPTESDMPQIFPSTSMSALPTNELMIVDDNDQRTISSPPPSLLKTQSAEPKPLVKLPEPQRVTPGSKIVRLQEACCLLDKLSKRKFTSDAWWSADERERIILDGKPPINHKRICGSNIPGELLENIKKLKWLTGCIDRRKFYCWTCLLFADTGVWVFNANQGLHTLDYTFKKHSNSLDHRHSEVLEQQWIKRNVDDKYRFEQKQITFASKDGNSRNDGETMAGQVHSYASMGMKPNNDHQKPCLIRMLLKNNFVRGSWKEGEQDEIVTQGRRCPSMEYVLGSAVSGYAETVFTDNLYVKYPWLTGSWERKKLYCWPCLLYNTENSCFEIPESTPTVVFENHEILNSHLESSLCLKLLEHDIKNRSMKGKVDQDQEAIKKRRDFLKHLIDVVCITKTTLKNSGAFEEDCSELLKLIASYNLNLEGFLNETSNATGKEAANYLVANHGECVLTAITHVMMKKIKREVQNSPFITIMLDDVKGLVNKSFISVIIRYVERNGEVHERFVKFIEVGYNRTSNNMIQQVTHVVNELGCESRLVGFSYDGAVIDPTDVKKFNSAMNEVYTPAQFFHNRNHNLKFLIQQALSHLKECRHFFQHLVPLANFFNSTPAAINELIELECKTLEAKSARVWDFSIEFIRTIHHHYPAMLKLLEKITKNPNDWDIDHVVQAPYHLEFLRNYQNRFFIVFLSEVFSVVGDLADVFQRNFDVDVWLKGLNEATTKLRLMDTKLERICQIACSDSLAEGDATTPNEQAETLKDLNRELYDNLLTCIINFISTRTENIDNLKFFDSDIISGIVDKSRDRTKEIIGRLTTTYCAVFSPLFNITKLKAQLDFHFAHKCFKPITSINELTKDMHEYEMSSTMAEFHRLLTLILTIPVASNFIEKTTSYERMASYVKSNSHNLTSVNAFVWMEKDLLESLQEEERFYDWVTAHFSKKPGKEHFRLPRGTKI